jgi:hypothetical protein
MMADEDLPEGDDEAERAYREDEAALFEALDKVMDERGIGEHDLVPLLLAAAYHYRSLAYVADTARPSEAGLKMDLDRLRKMVDEVHRGYRKNAAQVVAEIAEMLDAPEAVTPTSVLSEGSGR